MKFRNLLPILALATAPLLTPAAETNLNTASAPQKLEARSLKDCLLPAVKNGGFKMDGYIVWCSSVIKVGDTYHMFASAWSSQFGLAGWTTHSECVRATSTNLLGPYTFQEVVLQKRTNNWDNSRIHNVKIVRAGSKFVLYYINTANQTGIAVADSVTGPWTRRDHPVMKVSNPAPLVRPDLSIYVFGRLRDSHQVNRGIAFTAPAYDGPYTVVAHGENLLQDNNELEDPTIWWAHDQYNILLNDWKGKATGTNKDGAQYFSKDGIHYQLISHEPVFTKKVVYDDGTSETFARRERPFIYVNEKGEALALFTACLVNEHESRVVVQPIDHYVPGN
ncbi:MAG TPA: glycoside hydrolase family protein [Candidatus Angelobacter sp.]|nr:glycoside hydrolase family protein [Candidatus Angelobacter sp.]